MMASKKAFGAMVTALCGTMLYVGPVMADETVEETAPEEILVVQAEPEAEIKAELETVVVTASGFMQDIHNAPASISVITREQLEKMPMNNLYDAIKDVPGVNFIGGNANERDISIRGLPGDYTLILIDGRRMNTRETRTNGSGGFEASFIPPKEAIERIEVIRGPMSTLYGSEAMGGVINIITRKNATRWMGSVSLDHTFQESNKTGDTTNGSFFLSGPIFENTLGLQIMGSGHIRQEDKIASGHNHNDNKSAVVRLIATPTQDQEIMLEGGRTTQYRKSRDGYSASGTTTVVVGQSTNTSETVDSRNHAALSYNANWDWGLSKFSYQWDQAKHWSGSSSNLPKITQNLVDGALTFDLPRNMLTVGGQYLHGDLTDTSSSGPASKIDMYQYSLFLEDELKILESLRLTGGIRLDDHEHYGDYWSPRGYLVWNPTSEITVKGGVSKGFKAPGLRQLDPNYGYGTNRGRGVMYGDPNLQPETSTTEELGIAYHNDYGFVASVTLFNTDFKNKITNYATTDVDSQGRTIYKYDNIGKARIQGIETGLVVPFLDDFKFTFNYTYMDSERRSDEEVYSGGGSMRGAPLTMTPEHSYNARLDWQATEALSLYARMDYTGTQVYSNMRSGFNGDRYRSPYTTFDVGGSFEVNENMRVNFAVLNITDKWEDNPERLSGTENWDRVEDGRRYWLGVTVNF